MANLLSRFRGKPFFLIILMTLLTSSCSDGDDEKVVDTGPAANNAPSISSADSDTAPAGSFYTYTLSASDADGDTLTLQASILPRWLTFNAASGELSGTPSVSDAGDHSITLAAGDGKDTTPLFLTINVFVPNFAPVITSKAANNGVVGTAYSYSLTATDADTLAMSLVSTLPSWASFDAASGKLTGTPDAVGDHQVEFSVSDGELSTNQKFTLVVTTVPSVVIGFDESVVFSNFGGAVADVVANPDSSGINTSAKVGRMQKFAGEVYGGTTISLDDPITLAADSLVEQQRKTTSSSSSSIAASNIFTLKVWSQRQVALTFKLEGDVDQNDVERVVTHDGTGWELLSFDFTDVTGTGYTAITLIFENGVAGDAAGDAANWTFYFDDMVIPFVAQGGNTVGPEITVNGDFEAGFASWNEIGAIVMEGGNSIFQANVQAAGNPWDVSLNQIVALEADTDYILTFKAKASVVRAMTVGLGLNYDPWTSATEIVTLSTDWVTYTLNLSTTGFGDANNRIIFDMGAEIGLVSIDDVSLTLASVDDGGDTGAPELTVNGGFENAYENWNEIGAIVLEGGNNIFQADVQAAGNPWDVSLNQIVALEADTDYILTFKAKASVVRAMTVGLGLNYDPWTSATELVTLSTDWVTYTLNLSTTGFGDANNRIIFDMGAEIGVVSIDDVSLKLAPVDGGGDTGGGDTGGGDTGGGDATGSVSDFEGAADSYTWNNFGGGVASIVVNPDSSGINTSAQVGQMVKSAGEVYGGSTLTLDAPIDVADGSVFTLKVWSNRPVAVLFKLEVMNKEKSVNHGGTGWEELTFDFTGDSGTGVTGITLIFDLGIMGDAGNNPANWTFYFDDMTFPEVADSGGDDGGTDSGMNAVDFEVDGAGAAYTWTVFENDDNPALEVVANPDMTGANTSATVAKFTARQTGNPYAGVESAHGDFGPLTIDASNSTVKIMVWKSVVSDVGIKFAIANGGAQGEIKVANTLVNQWEELTFDFSGNIGATESINIDQIIIFPDFNARGAETVSYIDNIRFFGQGDGGTTSDSSIDFEATADSYIWDNFGGGAASIVVNPDSSGINTSAQVGQMVKSAGEVYGGSTLALNTPIDVADGSVFTLKVWSNRVVAVLFKLEVMNKERSVSHGGTGWEELTFDFSGDSGTGVTGITLIFDLGIMGDAGNNPGDWTFYFDDMTLPTADSGGDTGGDTGSGLSAVDFEAGGAGADYTWTVFENDDNPALEVVANPDMTGANTSATVAKFTARQTGNPYAGVESAHGDFGPLTIDVSNSTVKIMVWKTVVSDVGIKFAIANGGAQGEIKVANTLVNQWEELTFDFSGNIGATESINIDQIIIFPDFNARGAETVSYFDNITFGN